MMSSIITNLLTASQRKILSALLLLLTCMHPIISVAHAAETTTSADRAELSVIFPLDIITEAIASESDVETGADAPVIEPTVQAVLLSVCNARGYGEECAKTLLGMLWTESSNISTAIGDGGRARGYFQIHYRLHKISVACAEDLVCSAHWTIDYLESNGYPRYVNYAIQCHNSCGVTNGYAAKVSRNGKFFWSKPLKVAQTAPIVVAMK